MEKVAPRKTIWTALFMHLHLAFLSLGYSYSMESGPTSDLISIVGKNALFLFSL